MTLSAWNPFTFFPGSAGILRPCGSCRESAPGHRASEDKASSFVPKLGNGHTSRVTCSKKGSLLTLGCFLPGLPLPSPYSAPAWLTSSLSPLQPQLPALVLFSIGGSSQRRLPSRHNGHPCFLTSSH